MFDDHRLDSSYIFQVADSKLPTTTSGGLLYRGSLARVLLIVRICWSIWPDEPHPSNNRALACNGMYRSTGRARKAVCDISVTFGLVLASRSAHTSTPTPPLQGA
jgi:hypothetical protein